MKKAFRNSMFVLSFLGLFMIVSPKQAKADSAPPCQTYQVTCADGTVHNCIVCDEEDLIAFLEINCGVVIQK